MLFGYGNNVRITPMSHFLLFPLLGHSCNDMYMEPGSGAEGIIAAMGVTYRNSSCYRAQKLRGPLKGTSIDVLTGV